MYVTFGTRAELPRVVVFKGDREELFNRAIECGDEHAIKFTEVCLRERAFNPEPAFLTAADRAIELLSAAT